MLLSRDQVLAMNDADFRAFLARKVAEGHYLDYKIALSGDSEREQRREFLKDVTGFANALGGHIIIGAKEPADGQSVDEQLAGIADGESVAQALENVVRDSTQPRIAGFFIHPVKLAAGKWALVAHVPASANRPHMVEFAGHRTFYVRRRSSTEPMTVTEIREAILSAATAEGKARETIGLRRADAVRYFQNGAPMLLLQAVPIVSAEEPWPVEGEPFLSVMRGSDRRDRYHHYGIATQYGARITINGLLSTNYPDDPKWIWEVHRSGYVSILIRLDRREIPRSSVPILLLHPGFHDPFFVLAEMLEQFWRLTGFDAPYAMSSELFPARGSIFVRSTRWDEYSEPYFRDELTWPIYVRQPGLDPRQIARWQIVDLYHAYGLTAPASIEPAKL